MISNDTPDLFTRYPTVPGYKRSGTSQDAATDMESEAGTLRRLSLEILKRGAATADEVADALGRSILSIRPRISELVRKGLVTETGQRRTNRSGKSAMVWTAK